MTYPKGRGFLIETLELKPEWGSQNKDHRLAIRAELVRRYANLALSDLMDLESTPRLQHGFLSISHAQGLGGFVHALNPIGLDIEVTARVRPELAARIATIEEFSAAPDPAALWCAKEAVYKSLLTAKQPLVVMDLKIGWLSDGFILSNGAEFGVEVGRGRWWRQGMHTLALFSTRILE